VIRDEGYILHSSGGEVEKGVDPDALVSAMLDGEDGSLYIGG
jgi:hypothetical protein